MIAVEDGDGIDDGILQGVMIAMLGETFPEFGFILVVGSHGLLNVFSSLTAEVRDEVFEMHRKLWQHESCRVVTSHLCVRWHTGSL